MDTHELEWLREDLEILLPDTCDILTVTRTSDGAGGWSEVWTVTGPRVPCRLDAKTGGWTVSAEAVQFKHEFVLSLPYATAICAGQRVKHFGITYTVTATSAGSWLGCKRADLEVVQ